MEAADYVSEEEEPEADGAPTSKTPGVFWDKRKGKWTGSVSNPLKRTASGGRMFEYTSPRYSENEADAIAALTALRVRINAEYWEHVKGLAAADPKFDGVPLGPPDAAEVEEKTLYWRPNQHKDHKPYLVVRIGQKRARWVPACQHPGCPSMAVQTVKGSAKEFCFYHGGKCPHGHAWNMCLNCNPDVRQYMSNCSKCGIVLHTKRQRSQGGNGLCPGCDDRAAAEAAAEAAAAQGLAAPPAPKRPKLTKDHELKMLERLVANDYVQSFETGRTPRPGEFLREVYVDYRCALGREFKGDEKRFAYVDFVVHPKRGGKLVFLEVDEHEHKGDNYSILCDTTRMNNATASLALAEAGEINVLWLRLNPDTQFKIGSKLHKSSNTQRADAVCALLDSIEGKPTDQRMTVAYACYQMDADCTPLVTQDPEYHASVRAGVVTLTHTVAADGSLKLACVEGSMP
jgi:hypothetical protein